MGLFYIKNICEAHNWKVRLESEKGKGTEVLLFIKQPKSSFFSKLFGKQNQKQSELKTKDSQLNTI